MADKQYTGTHDFSGAITLNPMGTGTGQAQTMGVASVDLTNIGNIGTGEDDLMTYNLPANSLSADTKGIRIRAWFKTANNANNKTIKLKFGATIIASTGPSTLTDKVVYVDAVVFRTGASAQKTMAIRTDGSDGSDVDITVTTRTTPAEDTTTGTIIKATGEATANDDVVQEGMIIEFFN